MSTFYQDKLNQIIEQEKKKGLVDVKFVLGDIKPGATLEEVCKEICEVFEAPKVPLSKGLDFLY